MAQTVPFGVYFGFTLSELKAELVRYKAEVVKAGSRLAGASQNGQSYSFGARSDMTLHEWSMELQAALAYFGYADAPLPPQTAVDFRS